MLRKVGIHAITRALVVGSCLMASGMCALHFSHPGKSMDSPITVSDSSEPDWDLTAPDSDPDWTPSTIRATLYPIFL